MAQMPNNYYQWVSLGDVANVAAPQEWSTEMIIQDIMNTPQSSQLHRELQQHQQFAQSGLFPNNIIVSNSSGGTGKATITNSRAAASAIDLSSQQGKGYNSSAATTSGRGFQYNNAYQQPYTGHTKAMNKAGILTNKDILQQSPPMQFGTPPIKGSRKTTPKNQNKSPTKTKSVQRKPPVPPPKTIGPRPLLKGRPNTSMYERVVPKFVSEPEAHMAASVFATFPKIVLPLEQVNHWVSCPAQRAIDTVIKGIEDRRRERLEKIRLEMGRKKPIVKPVGTGTGLPKYQPRTPLNKNKSPLKCTSTSNIPRNVQVIGRRIVGNASQGKSSATAARFIDSDSDDIIEEIVAPSVTIQSTKKGRLSVPPPRLLEQQEKEPEMSLPTDPAINWEHRTVSIKTRDPERRRLAGLILSGDYDIEIRYRPRADKVAEAAAIELRKTEEEVTGILLQVCKTRKPSLYLAKNVGTRTLLYNKMLEQYKKTLKSNEFSEKAFIKYFGDFVESLDFQYQTTQDEKRDPFAKQKKELEVVSKNSRVEKELNRCYISIGMPDKVTKKVPPAQFPPKSMLQGRRGNATLEQQTPQLTRIPTGRRGRPPKRPRVEMDDEEIFGAFSGRPRGGTAKVTRGDQLINMNQQVSTSKRGRRRKQILPPVDIDNEDDLRIVPKKARKATYNTRNAPQESSLSLHIVNDIRSLKKIEGRLLNFISPIMEKRQKELRKNKETEQDVNECMSALLNQLDPIPITHIHISADSDADLIIDSLGPGDESVFIPNSDDITDPDFYDVSKLLYEIIKKVLGEPIIEDDVRSHISGSSIMTASGRPYRSGRRRKQQFIVDWSDEVDSRASSWRGAFDDEDYIPDNAKKVNDGCDGEVIASSVYSMSVEEGQTVSESLDQQDNSMTTFLHQEDEEPSALNHEEPVFSHEDVLMQSQVENSSTTDFNEPRTNESMDHEVSALNNGETEPYPMNQSQSPLRLSTNDEPSQHLA